MAGCPNGPMDWPFGYATTAVSTSAAPATGNTAIHPGKAARLVMRNTEPAISDAPAKLAITRARAVHRQCDGTESRPTNPPTPNSHARVGVAKNAIAGLLPVQATETTNEDTTTANSAAMTAVRRCARRSPEATTAASSSSGQTR